MDGRDCEYFLYSRSLDLSGLSKHFKKNAIIKQVNNNNKNEIILKN